MFLHRSSLPSNPNLPPPPPQPIVSVVWSTRRLPYIVSGKFKSIFFERKNGNVPLFLSSPRAHRYCSGFQGVRRTAPLIRSLTFFRELPDDAGLLQAPNHSFIDIVSVVSAFRRETMCAAVLLPFCR